MFVTFTNKDAIICWWWLFICLITYAFHCLNGNTFAFSPFPSKMERRTCRLSRHRQVKISFEWCGTCWKGNNSLTVPLPIVTCWDHIDEFIVSMILLWCIDLQFEQEKSIIGWLYLCDLLCGLGFLKRIRICVNR